jgi:hypothetical protein|tara:strand:- start:924 stop:2078 length:1155 start_codon:yes stop_codon:yes gene_type:complete
MGSVKRAVKKIARPKVILPLAAAAILGPAALTGLKGAALKGAAAKGSLMGSGAVTSALAPNVGIGAALKAAPALAGNFIKTGLMNPFSGPGAAVYGGAGLGLAALMGKPKTEEQKTLGVDPQAQYNLMRLMNEKMGGAYTDEELNILAAPQLSMYGGEYETITGPKRKRRPMFPGLNYSGLTRLAADGGSIKPKKRKDAVEEMAKESEQREIIMDALFDSTRPGMNEDLIAERMFDAMRRQELNPMGRKDGGIMLAMSDPSPDAERSDMLEDMALKRFGKPLSSLTDVQVIELEEDLQELIMEKMAKGGSVPQTKGIPNGMQIDGRGGGFIPMGARERKDDVPAMLAKNEFVMTADAVRAAGGGDVNKGAQRMYDLMNSLESKV